MALHQPTLQLRGMHKLQSSPLDRAGSRLRAVAPWAVAGLLHLLVLSPLLLTPVSKASVEVGAFGQSVSITLISSSARQPPAAAQTESLSRLAAMADRLSSPQPSTSTSAHEPASATSLSQLLGANGDAGGIVSKDAPSALGGTDDPLSRSFVSYRGSDPAKAASLKAKMQVCVGRMLFSRRIRVILDANGRLIGPATIIRGAEKPGSRGLQASVERCAPYTAAAAEGMPRSYEIDLP